MRWVSSVLCVFNKCLHLTHQISIDPTGGGGGGVGLCGPNIGHKDGRCRGGCNQLGGITNEIGTPDPN